MKKMKMLAVICAALLAAAAGAVPARAMTAEEVLAEAQTRCADTLLTTETEGLLTYEIYKDYALLSGCDAMRAMSVLSTIFFDVVYFYLLIVPLLGPFYYFLSCQPFFFLFIYFLL